MGVRFIRPTAFIFVIMIFMQGVITAEEAKVTKNTEYVSGKLLVKFYPEATDEKKAAIREELGAELIRCLDEISIEVWRLPDDLATDDAIKRLNEETSVECSEPEYKYRPQSISGQYMLKRE